MDGIYKFKRLYIAKRITEVSLDRTAWGKDRFRTARRPMVSDLPFIIFNRGEVPFDRKG
jgi:hypothetical protein